jgi:hypothetical protein
MKIAKCCLNSSIVKGGWVVTSCHSSATSPHIDFRVLKVQASASGLIDISTDFVLISEIEIISRRISQCGEVRRLGQRQHLGFNSSRRTYLTRAISRSNSSL